MSTQRQRSRKPTLLDLAQVTEGGGLLEGEALAEVKAALGQGARRRRGDPEGAIQRGIITWATSQIWRLPELEWLWHAANGEWRGHAAGGRLKALGVKPGVCDLLLLVPRQGFHGLLMELKAKGGALEKSQSKFLDFHREQGYRVEVIKDPDGATKGIRALIDYLGADPNDFYL